MSGHQQMTCRVCGCTDLHACPGGCFWVEPGLCSECNPATKGLAAALAAAGESEHRGEARQRRIKVGDWDTTWRGITTHHANCTRGQAVAQTLRKIFDAGYSPRFTDLRARVCRGGVFCGRSLSTASFSE